MCGAQVAELLRRAASGSQAGPAAAGERDAASAPDAASPSPSLPPSPAPVLLDVRPATQLAVMALPGVTHLPFEQLERRLPELLAQLGAAPAQPAGNAHEGWTAGEAGTRAEAGPACTACVSGGGSGAAPVPAEEGWRRGGEAPRVVVLCRRGNNSQLAALRLAAAGVAGVTDMRGGYQAWAREVDPHMPLL